jgi:hypothetical protein
MKLIALSSLTVAPGKVPAVACTVSPLPGFRHETPGEMPWPLIRAELDSLEKYGLNRQSIVDVIDDEGRGARPPLASVVHGSHARRRLAEPINVTTPLDLTSPLTRRPGVTAQPTNHRHDLVVVGARAAGAATALLLAQLGPDVVLLDRAVFPADAQRIRVAVPGFLTSGLCRRPASWSCGGFPANPEPTGTRFRSRRPGTRRW